MHHPHAARKAPPVKHAMTLLAALLLAGCELLQDIDLNPLPDPRPILQVDPGPIDVRLTDGSVPIVVRDLPLADSIRYRFGNRASIFLSTSGLTSPVAIPLPDDLLPGEIPLYLSLIEGGQNADTAVVTLNVIDDVAPSVAWRSPAQLAELTGTVTFEIDAADDVELRKVELFIGDQYVTDMIGAAMPFDTTRIPNGLTAITARATDVGGNVADSTRTFKVDNEQLQKPSVIWVQPAVDAELRSGEPITFEVAIRDPLLRIVSVTYTVAGDVVHRDTTPFDAVDGVVHTHTWAGFQNNYRGPVMLTVEVINEGGVSDLSSRTVTVR